MHYDVIIVGGGVVGSVAALALAKNTSLKIALLEMQPPSLDWQAESYDHRVSAISLSSQRILQNISVWEAIQNKRISPYTHMHVWDEGGPGVIDFDCREVQEKALGYIIEEKVMRVSLQQKISQISAIDFIHSLSLQVLKSTPTGVELHSQEGKIFSTPLLIAADGANSWVRERLQVELKIWDYEQTAIVATVQTALMHQKTAWQRFLTTGPLAFLPLADEKTSSIVWSATHATATELLALDNEFFAERLTTALQEKLGAVELISQRYHFPLRMRHLKNYVQEHIAFIGDAAHTIHPLAGQGMNLGLLDAAALTEVIRLALQKNRRYFSLATLRKYERWRKADNVVFLAAVEAFKRLFMNQHPTLKKLRHSGLQCMNQLPAIKNLLTHYALGNRQDLPSLATLNVEHSSVL